MAGNLQPAIECWSRNKNRASELAGVVIYRSGLGQTRIQGPQLVIRQGFNSGSAGGGSLRTHLLA